MAHPGVSQVSQLPAPLVASADATALASVREHGGGKTHYEYIAPHVVFTVALPIRRGREP